MCYDDDVHKRIVFETDFRDQIFLSDSCTYIICHLVCMQLLEKQFFSVCTRANTKKIARARRKINSALNSCHDLRLLFPFYTQRERLAVINTRVIRTKRVNGCIRYFPD